jgi:hypothetical protein
MRIDASKKNFKLFFLHFACFVAKNLLMAPLWPKSQCGFLPVTQIGHY